MAETNTHLKIFTDSKELVERVDSLETSTGKVVPSGDGDGTQLELLSPDGTTHYIRISNLGELISL